VTERYHTADFFSFTVSRLFCCT